MGEGREGHLGIIFQLLTVTSNMHLFNKILELVLYHLYFTLTGSSVD